jgi:hypothetical protein
MLDPTVFDIIIEKSQQSRECYPQEFPTYDKDWKSKKSFLESICVADFLLLEGIEKVECYIENNRLVIKATRHTEWHIKGYKMQIARYL